MPVYEQILPRDVPQTTTTINIESDEKKRNTLPGLDVSTSTCVDHHVNHSSKSAYENRYIDQPMHACEYACM